MNNYSKQDIPAWPDYNYETNTYDDTEKLDIIVDVDALWSYEWDRFLVLRDDEGNLYVMTGQGCSCNSLLDDVRSVADLEGPYTWHEVAAEAHAWGNEAEYLKDRRGGLAAEIVEKLMRLA